jgi:SH3 domain protein
VKRILVLLTLLCTAGLAQAETRYITDQLEVTLRTGTSTRHQIVRMVPSGTRVTVVQHDRESGYSQVRTPNGAEGWVLTRYLMDTPSARERLETTERRVGELQEENAALQQQLRTIQSEKGGTESERARLEGENRQINQQLAEIRRTAANALAIDSENQSLKNRILALERELQTLHQENASLKDRTARDWFMVGAGVILLGMLIGLVIPKVRWRKRSRWDSF